VAHQPTYLSFFSGCLGLDLGFHQAGYRCLSLNELNPHAQATIEQNLHRFGDSPPRLYRDSMLDLTPARILDDLGIQAGEVDVMIGGPPCQSFSLAGKRGGLHDPRGQLFLRFIDLIAAVRPRYAVIENVRGLLSKKLGALPVILAKIDSAGYRVGYKLYDAADFGVPQHRRRVIFFLARDGETVEPMVGTHGGDGQPRHATLRDAIEHLQGNTTETKLFPPSVLQYLQYVPAGGNWRSIPPELRPDWLLKATGNGDNNWFHRPAWDVPTRTLACVSMAGNCRRNPHCHPEELRGLSVEECAAIQTFPDGFALAGSRGQRYRQLGNAVPVKFARAIAEHLANHMARQPEASNLPTGSKPAGEDPQLGLIGVA
jgi:DNA (cytosine-5)-methyltransferase 1